MAMECGDRQRSVRAAGSGGHLEATHASRVGAWPDGPDARRDGGTHLHVSVAAIVRRADVGAMGAATDSGRADMVDLVEY